MMAILMAVRWYCLYEPYISKYLISIFKKLGHSSNNLG